MDINDIRAILIVIAFLIFLGIVAWAYSSRRKKSFDEAARLALEDGEQIDRNGSGK